MVTFVLDANIIIRLWRCAPHVLDLIEGHANTDYAVTNETVVELANGEIDQFFPKMAPKYQKLAEHMCGSDSAGAGGRAKTHLLVKEINGRPQVMVGNRISMVDFSMIVFCQNRPDCILVTDDKSMRRNAALVLERDRVLGYDEFLAQLVSRGLIDQGANPKTEADKVKSGEGPGTE